MSFDQLIQTLGTSHPKALQRIKKAYLYRNRFGAEPVVQRAYDTSFKPDQAYRDTLPDMTETVGAIEGAAVAIQHVGISGFKLPLNIARKYVGASLPTTLEATVTGTVSLESDLKGINMSRIIRTFYQQHPEEFTIESLGALVEAYKKQLESFSAKLRVAFRYPMLVPSLRSGLEGYQYYSAVYEASNDSYGRLRHYMELDFVYSSACPCSAELALHAMDTRGVYAIPHSQRSKARIRVEIAPHEGFHLEDLIVHARNALKTETQVMVKREDEQAFAELNGAYVKFVEDAARLLYQELNADARILDFRVMCSHLESLHSHDAVSVIVKGLNAGMVADVSNFDSLVC